MALALQLLGTGPAEGYPSHWCRCGHCTWAREHGGRNVRRSSAALLDGRILIDFPADVFVQLGLHGLDILTIDHIIITHGHPDHFHTNTLRWRYGEDFCHKDTLTRLPSRIGGVLPLHVHASRENIAAIKATLTFGPEGSFGLVFHELRPGESFLVHGIQVTPILSSHKVPADTPFNFVFKKDGASVLYLVDSDMLLPEAWRAIDRAEIDLVVAECTAWDMDDRLAAGHMNLAKLQLTWNEALARKAVQPYSRLVLTHLSHLSPPYDLLKTVPLDVDNVVVGFDGMVVQV